MKVLVSACLLGTNCKYNGGNNYDEKVIRFLEGKEVIPVCPEVMAGLPIPRIPMEIVNGVVTDREGNVTDRQLRETAEKLAAEFKDQDISCAVLKSRSPTCGVKQVYDGSFTGTLVSGSGIFAAALLAAGIRVIDAEECPEE